MWNIVLIDDDTELRNLLEEYLSREGYTITLCENGEKGIRALSGQDLVILDLMLPDIDGLEVLKRIKGQIPVILLTGKGDDVDRIVGLEMGADDYMTKPFNPRELLARIRAVMRRTASDTTTDATQTPPTNEIICGSLRLNKATHQVFLADKEIELTSIELKLLSALMEQPHQVFSRDNLLNMVQGRDDYIFDRSIDVHISHLRQKLGDEPQQPRFIKTIRSIGYKFIGS